jgi:hypothetical protein
MVKLLLTSGGVINPSIQGALIFCRRWRTWSGWA